MFVNGPIYSDCVMCGNWRSAEVRRYCFRLFSVERGGAHHTLRFGRESLASVCATPVLSRDSPFFVRVQDVGVAKERAKKVRTLA